MALRSSKRAFLTLKEVAELLGRTESTIGQWTRSGKLPLRAWIKGSAGKLYLGCLASDVLRFLEEYDAPLVTALRPGSQAQRALDQFRHNGRLAGIASGRARKAKAEAQRTASQAAGTAANQVDPGSSSEIGDPPPSSEVPDPKRSIP